MSQVKVASRYAKALLRSLSKLSDSTETIGQTALTLENLANLWNSNAEIRRFANNPQAYTDDKIRLFESVVAELAKGLKSAEFLKNFVRMLCKRQRLAALPDIAIKFSEFADELMGVTRVTVITAREIDSSELKDTESAVMKHVGQSPIISWKIDPSILGGMIIRYRGRIIDGSVASKLSEIKRSIA